VPPELALERFSRLVGGNAAARSRRGLDAYRHLSGSTPV
jgi:hypothetical protein